MLSHLKKLIQRENLHFKLSGKLCCELRVFLALSHHKPLVHKIGPDFSAKTIAPTALHRHGVEIHRHCVAIKNTPSPKPTSTSQSDSVRALRARAKCLIQWMIIN